MSAVTEVTDPGLSGSVTDDPGRPVRFSYVPALDGLRAIAVLGVMLYHGGAPLASGGFLGVNIFFVLSGFLITSLLLGEWAKRMSIRLGQFWARRARRLLPALLVMLIGVAIYAKVFATPGEYADLRLDSLSTLFYVANWHFIFSGGSYFDHHRPVLAAGPHVVAVHRGAVLHRVAPGGPCHAPARTPAAPVAPPVAPVGHRRGRGHRLGPRHAALLPAPRLDHPALRGDRHPLPGHPGGGGPGHRHGPVGPAPKSGARGDDGGGGTGRPRRGRLTPIVAWEVASPVTRLVLQLCGMGVAGGVPGGLVPSHRNQPVPLRGRLLPLRPRGGRAHLLRGHRPERFPVPSPRQPGVPLHRHDLLRRLPLAPPTVRPSRRQPGSTSTGCPCWPCASVPPWWWPPAPSTWWRSPFAGAGCGR